MTTPIMESVVHALMASDKGLLAADESFPTIEKRFKDIGVPSTEENRKSYREMLFNPPGLNEFISGVILFDETIRQRTQGGTPMPEMLTKRGIIPGIKVDMGTTALPSFANEKITQGLDGLRDRLIEYRGFGASFTKWRAVITIGKHIPTHTCIDTNVKALAQFAALSQEAQLVPIVEPEVLMSGDHTIARCEEVINATLRSIFNALVEHRVTLEQMLLKTSMVLPGERCTQQADNEEIAERTVRCLRRTVPAAVPGVVFLSGGQSEEAATQRLNAICKITNVPWKLSFSFARALQTPALQIWKGSPANIGKAQKALYFRAKCNHLALQGKYSAETERTNWTD